MIREAHNFNKKHRAGHKIARDAGFTLVELIIVIAIIAVLTAVLVPQYIKYVESSRKTVCENNRSEIIRAVDQEHIAHGDLSVLDIYARDHAEDRICPSGGVITAGMDANGHLTLTCSKHNTATWNKEVIATIKQEFDKKLNIANNMDSGALVNSNSQSSAVVAALKDVGIDLEKMDAKSWAYIRNNNSQQGIFCWTSVDIQNTAVDTLVPVMRYNANLGTYTAWMYRVTTVSNNGYTYNVLRENRAVETSESKALTPEEKKEMAGALNAYQTAIQSYNQGS